MDTVFDVKNLTLAYNGNIVLRNLSFSMPKGKIMLITGENGSGKSTLIRALLGLIKPLSGTVVFNGGRKNGVGYLPQQTGIQRDFPATVREVVISGCIGAYPRVGLFYPKAAKKEADRAMALTGVDKLSRRCYNELSGGQQQRTLLARALCAADRLLILDEPANGLDPESTADMYSIIRALRGDGMSVLMVSHDIEASSGAADIILHLCCGGAFCCSAEEYAQRIAEAHGIQNNDET